MNVRVSRKYFYQRWRGYSPRNNTRREIVFLLLGAPRYTLGFGTLLRLTFIRINCVMNDDSIVSLFNDEDMSQFVKFAFKLPTGELILDLKLLQAIPIVGADISQVLAYLDLSQIYHDIGVDLASTGPDPMSAPEAFYLKLLWPGYVDSDEKYLAIIIAGILVTRSEQDRNLSQLPPYSMHLTEVGMHLKLLEEVDASLAWALPSLKQEGLRLARFLGKRDTERYFSVSDSPYHHSDKVVSLNVDVIWEDAEKVWSVRDVSFYLQNPSRETMTNSSEIDEHLEYITQSCAEAALEDPRNGTKEDFLKDRRRFLDSSLSGRRSGFAQDQRPFGRELDINNASTTVRDEQYFQKLRRLDSNERMKSTRSIGNEIVDNGYTMSPAGVEFDGENLNSSIN